MSERKKKKDEEKIVLTKEERTKHVVLITVLIVLLMGVGCAMGYAIGGASIIKEVKGDSKQVQEKNLVKKENLDIHSRVVDYLYHEITRDEDTPLCTASWQFNESSIDEKKDFFAEEASETVKMNLVGMNLNTYLLKDIDLSFVPARSDAGSGYVQYGNSYGKYYTKEYVEAVYKQIYGKDADLDTTVPIKIGVYGGHIFYYDAATQRYYAYNRAVGGTCGPVGYKLTLKSATREGDIIEIFQHVEHVNEGKVDEEFNYVYSFAQESDGLYRFISRVKETA